jgi:hypothetical protein
MNLRAVATFAFLVLAGCAGSAVQPQPLAPQSRTATYGASWMSPDAGGKNLLYVSDYSSVLVYEYGTSSQVGQLSYFSYAAGSCTDPSGDIYVANYGAADVVEFAHGGSKPVKTLIDPSPYATDCAFDPSTGDLAVINKYGQSEYSPGNVAIYAGAKGTPKTYKIKGFVTYVSGAYDPGGNLLVSDDETSGLKFAMLPHGSKSFEAVTLPHGSQMTRPGYVRWDGEYFDVEYSVSYDQNPSMFVWYTIKGTKGTQEGYMITEESGENCGPFWLGRVGGPKSVKRANQLVASASSGYGGVFGWEYPQGGAYVFDIYNDQDAGGITASIVR